ncbi:MAG: efflux RND transporter periplasmic adaptor subunit [Alphaproteobacteria bacterium]|nr:MAG: efflux RND transporter periplasmic adaptor subunit [Alphaproteobacteria bacterium]
MIVASSKRPGVAGAVLVAILAIGAGTPALAADPACPGGKVKLYRDPMGGPDTSPVPKKDSMNMEYIAVCEGEAEDVPGTVRVSLDKVQRLGVRSAEVGERDLSRTVRAFATLQFDERKQYVVAPRYSGWIEKLHVNATGDTVERGEPLFEAYSPELAVLQQEWRIAGRSGYAADKLRNLGYPEAELEKLKRGDAFRTVTIRSPASGIVIEKTAVEGMRFGLGDALFRIVDTSTMWVMAEVYEQDLAFVKLGDTARIAVNAWPDRPFDGKVTFIYPSVGRDSRTARLRIEVANPDGRLRADMAATAEIMAPVAGSRVAIPESALIDTGRRQVVLVERGEGRYEPRPVKTGAHVPGWVQVTDGVKPGERVVTQATFLIDAESNIRAALAAFGAGEAK